MNIENTGTDSTKLTFGQGLAMPFLDRQITINAHVEGEVNEMQNAYSKSDFRNNVRDKKWQVAEDVRDVKAMEMNEELSREVDVIAEFSSNIQQNTKVSYFQSSTLLDGSGLVYEALRNGYPADRAIVVGKAQESYSKILNQEKIVEPVNNLINKNHQVK